MSEFNPKAFVASLGDRRACALTAEPDPKLVVPGCKYLREGRITMEVGREGEGKTTLTRQISAAATVGRHYLDEEIDPDELCGAPGPVVWVSHDEPPGRTKREFDRFSREYGDADHEIIHCLEVEDLRYPAALHAVLQEYKPVLLVVDPLGGLVRPERDDYRCIYDAVREWLPYTWQSKPERSEEQVADWIEDVSAETHAGLVEDGYIDEQGYLLEPAMTHRLPAVLALTHACKEREMRQDSVSRYLGSVAWGASVDCIVDMGRASINDESNIRKLKVGKSRFDDLPAKTVDWIEWDDGQVVDGVRYKDGDSSYGYSRSTGPAPKLKPPKTATLAERVTKHIATHPDATKASTARALGLDPAKRHGASYKQIASMFDPKGAAC